MEGIYLSILVITIFPVKVQRVLAGEACMLGVEIGKFDEDGAGVIHVAALCI